ncbi:MAG: hypothetical protein AB1791_07080 [Chloroflexota bacterium]
MAQKKVRRVTRPPAGLKRPPVVTPEIDTPVSPARPRQGVAVPAARPPLTRQEVTAEEFKAEYAYVLKDLRRVFALAAVMFTLLILLNLFLR